jgi:hypothetical protein
LNLPRVTVGLAFVVWLVVRGNRKSRSGGFAFYRYSELCGAITILTAIAMMNVDPIAASLGNMAGYLTPIVLRWLAVVD